MTPAAGNPEHIARVQQQVAALLRKSCYHTLELNGGSVIPGLIPVAALRHRIGSYPIPADLRGKRVLDMGAASGWNAFEMERRGASVMAVDCVEYEELPMARDAMDSRVDYRLLDIEELSPRSVGVFDYTIFFGVLYHLRHPLLGLEKICAITRETAFVESFVSEGDACTMEFYETTELGGQIDNWFGPTANCLAALCRSAGFARVNLEYVHDRRAGFTCHRKWEAADPAPGVIAPWICSAVNNRTNGVEFHPDKDEYICLYFRDRDGLTLADLRVEIDGLGAPAIILSKIGVAPNGLFEWQTNLRVPPGLAEGPHEVRMRTVTSPYSNGFEIVMGVVPHRARPAVSGVADPPSIIAVENSFDRTNVFRGYKTESLSCRFRSGEADLTGDAVTLEIDGVDHPIRLLTDLSGGEWQINARLSRDAVAGEHSVRVKTARSGFSEPAAFVYDPA